MTGSEDYALTILRKIDVLDRRIERAEYELDYLARAEADLGALVPGHGINFPVMRDDMQRIRDESAAEREKIVKAIGIVETSGTRGQRRCGELLRLRYMEHNTLEKATELMNISWEHGLHLHVKAKRLFLAALDEIERSQA